MRRRAALLAALCLLSAGTGCARRDSGDPPGPARAGASGIRGVATVDLACPVLETASPCPRQPLRARVLVLRPNAGDRVAAVETGDDGRFRLALSPGRYEVRGENLTGQPVPVARPVAVDVRAGEFADVTIEFDSGVRGAPPGQ